MSVIWAICSPNPIESIRRLWGVTFIAVMFFCRVQLFRGKAVYSDTQIALLRHGSLGRLRLWCFHEGCKKNSKLLSQIVPAVDENQKEEPSVSVYCPQPTNKCPLCLGVTVVPFSQRIPFPVAASCPWSVTVFWMEGLKTECWGKESWCLELFPLLSRGLQEEWTILMVSFHLQGLLPFPCPFARCFGHTACSVPWHCLRNTGQRLCSPLCCKGLSADAWAPAWELSSGSLVLNALSSTAPGAELNIFSSRL